MKAGKLRHRVVIEQPSYQVNPATGSRNMVGWVEVCKVWASIEPLSARDFIAAGNSQSKVIARVKIRRREGLTAEMRAVHRRSGLSDVIYKIEGVLPDPDSGFEYVTLPVSSGVSVDGR